METRRLQDYKLLGRLTAKTERKARVHTEREREAAKSKVQKTTRLVIMETRRLQDYKLWGRLTAETKGEARENTERH